MNSCVIRVGIRWQHGTVDGRDTRHSCATSHSESVALVLPLGSAYIDGVLGNGMHEVVLTALATFIPPVFLHTARDFILANARRWIGNALLLQVIPPPAVGVPTLLMSRFDGSCSAAWRRCASIV